MQRVRFVRTSVQYQFADAHVGAANQGMSLGMARQLPEPSRASVPTP